MKKIICILFCTISFFVEVKAQNEFDVLRYSSLDFYGDARFNAMGGSFGALGANMSSLSINPGGIGVYKSSDFSFTPAFHQNYSKSKSDGITSEDGKLNFHFANVGLVGTFDGSGDWKSVSFGVGYNRTSNFNTSISVSGVTDSSALNTFTNELNAGQGTFETDINEYHAFSANLAYQTYLVNPLIGDSTQYNHAFSNSKNIAQFTSYETRGGSGEMFFATGANYNNKLYLGASVGIPTVRFSYDRYYSETADPSDTLTDFNSYSMHDYVSTSGAGFNFKLGLIYKVVDWFRIGTAFHTPTVYSLHDDYESSIVAEHKDGTILEEASPYGSYDYVVTTPYRFISSASIILGNYGVINGDFELVDYASARLKTDNYNSGSGAEFVTENQNIRNNFVMAHNIRVGTEWRIDPFRIRAGYRFQGNSLSEKYSSDNSASIYSAGLGIKEEEYYFDIAYSLKTQDVETIVIADQSDVASTNLKDHYITFTLGFRF